MLARCSMSCNGQLWRPGGISPLCFSSTIFIVGLCLLIKTCKYLTPSQSTISTRPSHNLQYCRPWAAIAHTYRIHTDVMSDVVLENTIYIKCIFKQAVLLGLFCSGSLYIFFLLLNYQIIATEKIWSLC